MKHFECPEKSVTDSSHLTNLHNQYMSHFHWFEESPSIIHFIYSITANTVRCSLYTIQNTGPGDNDQHDTLSFYWLNI